MSVGESISCEGYSLTLKCYSLFDLFTFKKVVADNQWKRSPLQDEERADAQRPTARRWGSTKRSRPRPLSDYGQLAIRSFSIPEDSVAMESQEGDCVDGDNEPRLPSVELGAACPVANERGRKRRPISVIGGVNFYGNSQTEETADLLAQVRQNETQKTILPFCFLACDLQDRQEWTLFSSFCFSQIIINTMFLKHEITLTISTI